MYSGRRYCVQRHIDNIHNGKANAVPFVEYLLGRRDGSYPPFTRPSFASQKQKTLKEKTEEEFGNVYARRAVESVLPPVGDGGYLIHMTEVENDVRNRQYRTGREELVMNFEILKRMISRPSVVATQGTTSKGTPHEHLYNEISENYQKVDRSPVRIRSI